MISSCVAPALLWWLPRSYDIFLSSYCNCSNAFRFHWLRSGSKARKNILGVWSGSRLPFHLEVSFILRMASLAQRRRPLVHTGIVIFRHANSLHFFLYRLALHLYHGSVWWKCTKKNIGVGSFGISFRGGLGWKGKYR